MRQRDAIAASQAPTRSALDVLDNRKASAVRLESLKIGCLGLVGSSYWRHRLGASAPSAGSDGRLPALRSTHRINLLTHSNGSCLGSDALQHVMGDAADQHCNNDTDKPPL